MSKGKWRSLVVILLITALLASSCGLFDRGGGGGVDDYTHQFSAEVNDSYEGPVLDYGETFPYEFERRERPELGENAAEFEGVELEWNEAVRFISDELADKILLAEARIGEEEISVELDQSEAIYEAEVFLVHEQKRVGYFLAEIENGSESVTYTLIRVHPELLIEDFYIPEQTVYLNEDNISYLADGVKLVSGDSDQASSNILPFGPSTVFAESNDVIPEITLEVNKEFFIDDQTGEPAIWVNGLITFVRPHLESHWEKGKDTPFHFYFVAGQDIDLEVGGDISFNDRQELPITGFDIPFRFGEAKVGLFIVIEVDGSISFEYKFEQGTSLRTGVEGLKGRLLPQFGTVRYRHQFDSYLNVNGRVDGYVRLQMGVGAIASLTIGDYDILKLQLAAGLAAEARYEQDLTYTPDEGGNFHQCFTLSFHAFLIVDGVITYPKLAWEDLEEFTWYDLRTYGVLIPKIETVTRPFDIYSNTWLIYKYERCGEDVGSESDFAIAQQPLIPGANLLVVRASDNLAVDIASRTGHGNTTGYYATNIPPGTEVHLRAPLYVGEGAERKEFARWFGFETVTNPEVSFTIDRENAELSMTAEYIASPVYDLYVWGPAGLTVDSNTGHGGVTETRIDVLMAYYVIEEIAENTRVQLSAPGAHDVPPMHCNMDFQGWEAAVIQRQQGGLVDFQVAPIRTTAFLMDSDKLLTAYYSGGERCSPDLETSIPPWDIVIDMGRRRQGDAPVNYSLTIKSAGVSSVPINGGFINPLDGSTVSRFSENTTFAFENLIGRKVTLTAPLYVGSGEARFRFERWSGESNISQFVSLLEQPTGDFDFETTSRSVDIDIPLDLPWSKADADKIVTAHYVPDPDRTTVPTIEPEDPDTPDDPPVVQPPSLYTLTVNSTGDDQLGVNIVSNTGHGGKTSYQVANIEPQARVQLEAPEYLSSGADRKRFTGWSGAVSSSNRSITLTMDNNKTVTANYVSDPGPIARPTLYSLTVTSTADDPSNKIGVDITSKTGHGGRTPYTISGIEPGTEVHLEAPAKTELVDNFTGWSGDISDKNLSVTFTVNKNMQVQAGYWFTLF